MNSDVGEQFVPLTQSTDVSMSSIEMRMCWSRYSRLRSVSSGAVVVEVGSGQGLATDYISSVAKSYIQVDYSFFNSRVARHVNNANAMCASAEYLPIADGSADVVAALEMIYYLPDLNRFFSECRRVLSPHGLLFITMPNPERSGFHRSPHSTSYPTSAEISSLLADAGFNAHVEMAFEMPGGIASRALRATFTIAESLRLVPRSLKGRARLKRLLQGRTAGFPGLFELEQKFSAVGDGVERNPVTEVRDWSLIYVTGRPRI